MNSNQGCDIEIRIPGCQTSLSAELTCVSESDPLLLFAHGFAGDKDEKGLFSEAAEYFFARGYSVLRFDFRGCGTNNGSFRNVRIADLENDLKNVLAFVSKDIPLKPKSIGVVGFSLGATISILANPKGVKAYAFWSPAIFTDRDMYPRYNTAEIHEELSSRGFFVKSNLEVGPGFLSDLKENAVREKIKQVSKPVLMIHGDKDTRIPASSTKEASLMFRRRPTLCLIPGADHSFRDDPVHRNHAFSATAKFFDGHLRGRSNTSKVNPSLFQEQSGGSTGAHEIPMLF